MKELRPPLLCYVTHDEASPVDQAKAALEGGADMIQLRHKSASGSLLSAWAREMQNLCSRHHATFIVNDRLDIAMVSCSTGVHLGQEDIPVDEAQRIFQPDGIIGCSCDTLDEARRAERAGADYIGLGHIFPTGSKQKNGPPLGTSYIGKVKHELHIPVIAIGGITLDNAREVILAGADGIAVISAIGMAPDPVKATAELKKIIQEAAREKRYGG